MSVYYPITQVKGLGLYGVLTTPGKQWVNGSTPENFNSANWTGYVQPTTDEGSGIYWVLIPAGLAAGTYLLVMYLPTIQGVQAYGDIPYFDAPFVVPWTGTALQPVQSGDTFSQLPANFSALAITSGAGLITVGTNTDKLGYALTSAEHTLIADTDVPSGLTLQGLTTIRAGKLDDLDAAISTRSTYAGGPVASVTGDVSGNVAGSVGSVLAGVALSPNGLPSISGTVGANPSPTGFNSVASFSVSYVNSYLSFTSGVLQGQGRRIAINSAHSTSFVFLSPFNGTPSIGDTFDIYGGPAL